MKAPSLQEEVVILLWMDRNSSWLTWLPLPKMQWIAKRSIGSQKHQLS